mgnify:FL=1
MKSDIHKELARFKKLDTIPGLPEDLEVAIKTFIEQTVIIGEYGLETMPGEYVEKLLMVLVKYPKYDALTKELIYILRNQ